MSQRFEKEHDLEIKDPLVWNIIERNVSSQFHLPSVPVLNELAFGLRGQKGLSLQVTHEFSIGNASFSVL